MTYKKINESTYVISLSPGDEIIDHIARFLDQENISNAYFSGIGAVKKIELAHYRVDNRKYSSRIFDEPMEIANITGNAFTFDGKPLVHAHATVANDRFETFSGHLVTGIISAACEIVLIKLESELTKRYHEEIGLKLLTI
ncbi:MAG: PPC domain-containing DNA-binding protein [Candidatus Omnitrophota bacterium]